MTRFVLAVLGSLCVLCVSQAIAGGMILVDEGDNYINDGQLWNADVSSPRTGLVPFALDFGTGSLTNRAFTLDTRGSVNFAGTDFFAPLLAPTPFGPDQSIFYSTGLLDPSVVNGTTATSFSKANGLQAMRFYWNFVCPSGQPNCGQVQFQGVLVGLDADHFVLEFNYNASNQNINGGTAGYHLGANVGTFAGPYAGIGPDYCFDHGTARAFTSISACLATTSSTVPEPGQLALFGLGLAALVGFGRRRRGSPSTH